jgi:hypothetical protein
MCAVDDDLHAQRAQLLLVCVQVLLEKPSLAAHWLACAGSVTMMMMMMMMKQNPGIPSL